MAPGWPRPCSAISSRCGSSLRAATIVSLEGALREFAGWLVREAPEVSAVALLRRNHIENYKLHLAGRDSARGGRLSKTALAEHIGDLRTCFERLTEWAGDDAPPPCWSSPVTFLARRPIAAFPRRRGGGEAAAAARADPDPFARLAVEFLARTGLRKGEFWR